MTAFMMSAPGTMALALWVLVRTVYNAAPFIARMWSVKLR
jgi:hypothetical protein